jgi:hypothetical protein
MVFENEKQATVGWAGSTPPVRITDLGDCIVVCERRVGMS